jgi:hypothetical protein
MPTLSKKKINKILDAINTTRLEMLNKYFPEWENGPELWNAWELEKFEIITETEDTISQKVASLLNIL